MINSSSQHFYMPHNHRKNNDHKITEYQVLQYYEEIIKTYTTSTNQNTKSAIWYN
ncbi:22684_t:CDS:2 [Cetraspora pellucida]|uniref:22684_t:CDS:1 n=1 Tax=Cetraspora pellucida TaxID=1433469 RepID=A0A9N9DG76_9GLOM|nr:22684_t:CDS:2 [Cetraspora pellucida]